MSGYLEAPNRPTKVAGSVTTKTAVVQPALPRLGGSASGPPSPEALHFRLFTTDDGLPQDTVLSLAQTRDGYLWLSYRNGVARFDGQKFTDFNPRNTPQMKNGLCRSLAVGPDDSLWIGNREGLLRLKQGVFRHYGLAGQNVNPNVFGLCFSRDGTLWIAAYPWVTRFKDEQFFPIPRQASDRDLGYVLSLAVDREDQLWVAAAQGAQRFDPKRLAFVDGLDQGRLQWPIKCVFNDHSGVFWFGGLHGELSRLNDGQVEIFTVADMPDPPRYRDGEVLGGVGTFDVISEDRLGNLWLGTDTGLYAFRDGRFHLYEEIRTPVHALLWDREDNLWAGTDTGLWRVARKLIETLTEKDGLAHPNVFSVCQGPDESVWIGTRNGVSQWKDGKFTTHRLGEGQWTDCILTVYAGSSGTVWAGGNNGVFRELREGRFIQHPVPGAPTFRSIFEDRAGGLWLGTGVDLWQRRNGTFKKSDSDPGMPQNEATNAFQDRAGNIWIGTTGGALYRLSDGKFTAFTAEEGLPGRVSMVVHEDEAEALWIGTDDGLTRYKDGRLAVIPTSQGLPDPIMQCLLEDNYGNYWSQSRRGIYRVSKEQLNACADGRTNSVQCILYGLADGMLSLQANNPNWPNASKTKDGRLWFPTIKGLSVLDPGALIRDEPPPLVIIEQVEVDGKTVHENGPHQHGAAGGEPARADVLPRGRRGRPTGVSAIGGTSDSILRLQAGRGRVLEFYFTARALESEHAQEGEKSLSGGASRQ